MAKNILKYQLNFNDRVQTILLREGAILRSLQVQARTPTLWVEVDPDAPEEYVTFHIVGTGWDIPSGLDYIGTLQDGPYVWHFFKKLL